MPDSGRVMYSQVLNALDILRYVLRKHGTLSKVSSIFSAIMSNHIQGKHILHENGLNLTSCKRVIVLRGIAFLFFLDLTYMTKGIFASIYHPVGWFQL